jgi:hypothetical protein
MSSRWSIGAGGLRQGIMIVSIGFGRKFETFQALSRGIVLIRFSMFIATLSQRFRPTFGRIWFHPRRVWSREVILDGVCDARLSVGCHGRWSMQLPPDSRG